MGSRGASSGVLKPSYSSSIKTGERDVDASRAGKTYSELPRAWQNVINDDLKMSMEMKQNIADRANGSVRSIITDEAKLGIRTENGVQRVKVITNITPSNEISYTVKQGNKTLRKNATKEQAAAAMAQFVKKYLKR